MFGGILVPVGFAERTAVAQTVITVQCSESKKKLVHGQKGGGFCFIEAGF